MPFVSGIGPLELIIILVIALIVVGPGRLPDVGAALGKSIREFRKAATDVKDATSLDPGHAGRHRGTGRRRAAVPAVSTPAAARRPPRRRPPRRLPLSPRPSSPRPRCPSRQPPPMPRSCRNPVPVADEQPPRTA